MALSAGAVVAQFDGDFSGLNKGLQQAQNKVDGFTGGINNAGKKISGVFSSIGGAALKVSSLIGGVVTTGFVGFAVKTSAELQSLSASFETLTGSAEAGKKVFMDLKKMGASTPFETKDLAKATQVMLSFGISVENSKKYLNMLGDVSLGNREKLAGLSLVFSQIQANGKLMGQDFLQLINQGFNPLTIIAEKTGKSMSTLKKEMEDGKISAQMVADAFKTATSEGGLFYQGMDRGAKTLGGTFSTLMDNIGMMASGLAGLAEDGTIVKGSLLDLTQNGINYLNEKLKVIDWVKVGQDIQTNVINTIESLKIKLQELSNFYNNNKLMLDFLIGSFIAFGAQLAIVRTALIIYNGLIILSTILTGGFAAVIAFLTSPIGIVITIITVLIGLVTMLIRNWEKMPAPIREFGNTLVTWFKAGWNAVNSIIGIFKTFIGVLDNIKMPAPLQKIFDVIKGVTGMGSWNFKIPGFANGVRNFSGGLAVVGERGPELVNLPKGADVFSNEESRRMTAGGGGITIETMNIKSGVDWELGASYMAQKLRLS